MKKASKDMYLLTYRYINDFDDYLLTVSEHYFDSLKKAERFSENLKKDLKTNLQSYKLEKITLVTEYYPKKWDKK
jgi:hypothetical protein